MLVWDQNTILLQLLSFDNEAMSTVDGNGFTRVLATRMPLLVWVGHGVVTITNLKMEVAEDTCFLSKTYQQKRSEFIGSSTERTL